MALKVIGRDVTVLAYTLGGFDGAPSSGATFSAIGKWESVNIDVMKDWSVVSSSDAHTPEKRKKMQDFKGSLKGWVDSGGSNALLAFLNADLIVFSMTDTLSGKTVTCRAGITKAGFNGTMDHFKDQLDFEEVGSANFGGAPTFLYG